MSMHYDKAEIRDVLDAMAILDQHGFTLHRSGKYWRSEDCPHCGFGRSKPFVVHEDGHFKCHRCGIQGGDTLALFALLEDLDIERDFPQVLARAAALVGVEPGPPPDAAERARRRRAREDHAARRLAQQRQADAQRRDQAHAMAAPLWDSLAHRHPDGEAYLATRGLEALIGRSDVVRFDRDGNVRIPLHDYRGRIVSVPGRRIKPTGEHDKIVWMKGCPTLGTFGRFSDLNAEHKTVYLCEGIIDYLTGLVRFSDGLVLSAHGASNLPKIAAGIAPALKQTKRQLCFIPHIGDANGTGIKAAAAASKAAKAAGMPPSSVVYIHVTFGDLNDFHLRQRKHGQQIAR